MPKLFIFVTILKYNMRRKYKMTGCARFLIFLLIFTPLVLIGVSVYNGHNPIEQVKELLNIDDTEKPATKTINTSSDNGSSISSENILKSTIETQKTTIEELRKEVSGLEKQLKDKDREIQFLKQSGNE
jgi:cell division protein FtsL